jgi:hypothetical protein
VSRISEHSMNLIRYTYMLALNGRMLKLIIVGGHSIDHVDLMKFVVNLFDQYNMSVCTLMNNIVNLGIFF